jgi:hypothetical protein
MFRETMKEQHYENNETDHKKLQIWIYSSGKPKSIENSSVLAALTFVDISGALIGAVISVSLFIALATTLLAQLRN